MSKVLPNPGTYPARRSGRIVIKEEESLAVTAYVPYVLMGCDISYSGKHGVTIVKKDGGIMGRNVDALKKVFGWDGLNLFALEEDGTCDPLGKPFSEENQNAEFELAECFHEDYNPKNGGDAVTQFTVNWFNPIGGSANMPQPVDAAKRKELLTKYGSKLKALSNAAATPEGKKKAEPAKEQKQAELPAGKAAANPPRRPTATATVVNMTEAQVWEKLNEKNPEVPVDELSEKFYTSQDKIRLRPQENPGPDFAPAEWGKIAADLGLL